MSKARAAFKKVTFGHQFIGFALVGVVSTVLDFLVLNLCYGPLGLSLPLATALGFLTGLTNGYFMNGHLVFEQGHSAQRYFKYGLISLGGLILTELIVNQLHAHVAGLSVNLAKLAAVFIVFFWNYFWSKTWAFR